MLVHGMHFSLRELKTGPGKSCYICGMVEWGDGCSLECLKIWRKQCTANNTYYITICILFMCIYVWHVCMFVWWPQDKQLCVSSGRVHLFYLRKARASHHFGPRNSRVFPVSASPVWDYKSLSPHHSCFRTLNPRIKLMLCMASINWHSCFPNL